MKYRVSYERKRMKRDERVLCRIERVYDTITDAAKCFTRAVDALGRCELSGRIEWVTADDCAEIWHDYRDRADIVLKLEDVGE